MSRERLCAEVTRHVLSQNNGIPHLTDQLYTTIENLLLGLEPRPSLSIKYASFHNTRLIKQT